MKGVKSLGLSMVEADIPELSPLAFGDERHKAFGIGKAWVPGFNDMAIHGGVVMVTDDFNGDTVPDFRIHRSLEFHELLGLGGFGDA